MFYSFVEVAWASSFTGLNPDTNVMASYQFLYFSFVTLTTLGYGDISPSGPLAETLAYLPAVFGQMYIAVLIAGLVGGWVAKLPRG